MPLSKLCALITVSVPSESWVHTICIHNLQEIHNTYTIGVCKLGEADKGRQPSQPEPSKPGKGKMYNTSKQYKKTYHTLYNTLAQTNSQANQSPASQKKYKIQVNNTYKHTAINPVIMQLAWQTSLCWYQVWLP